MNVSNKKDIGNKNLAGKFLMNVKCVRVTQKRILRFYWAEYGEI